MVCVRVNCDYMCLFFVDFDVTCVMRGVLIRDSKSFIHVVRRENSNVVGVVFFYA